MLFVVLKHRLTRAVPGLSLGHPAQIAYGHMAHGVMYVCMHVCTLACMYVCMCAVCINARMYAFMYRCVHVMYVCVHLYM